MPGDDLEIELAAERTEKPQKPDRVRPPRHRNQDTAVGTDHFVQQHGPLHSSQHDGDGVLHSSLGTPHGIYGEDYQTGNLRPG